MAEYDGTFPIFKTFETYTGDGVSLISDSPLDRTYDGQHTVLEGLIE